MKRFMGLFGVVQKAPILGYTGEQNSAAEHGQISY
jgi:hypothetical protein